MTETQAKDIALRAVRRRFTTAVDAVERHMEANQEQYLRMSPDDVVILAQRWLERNEFGPEYKVDQLVATLGRISVDRYYNLISR